MSIRLVVEVLDNRPPNLSAQETLLLVALAERANERTRECWPGMDELRHRLGVKTDHALNNLFRSLRDKGLEVRKQVTDGAGRPVVDKSGRPLFAMRGHQTTYQVPRFTHRQRPNKSLGHAEQRPNESLDKAPTNRSQRPNKSLGPNPQEPSREPSFGAARHNAPAQRSRGQQFRPIREIEMETARDVVRRAAERDRLAEAAEQARLNPPTQPKELEA